jgi:hypothetical protein
LGGSISAGHGLIATNCVVRNTSATGARLIVVDPTRLPDAFKLRIPRKKQAYQARVRWRRRDHVGVEIAPFAATDVPVPLAMARRIKDLEAENAALRRQLASSE